VYVGANVGGGFAQTNWHWVNDNFFDNGPGDRSSIDPVGYVAGFHGGAQHQIGCWVGGIEGTFSGGNVTKEIASPFFPDDDHHTASITSFATVTGRLGYSLGNMLLYGKAGFATGKVELLALTDRLGEGAGSRAWQSGWVVGGGFDYQVGRNILFGVDYNYINLGERSHTFTCSSVDCAGFDAPIVKTDVDMHVVTARVTFLFGGPMR
jgi:outer membrane immunogenic protein